MSYELENVRILIVDDMRPMASMLSSILTMFGFNDIKTASNGQDGFDILCEFDPDIVITDWIMSPIDGLEFTKMIRTKRGVPNPYVPVIMMTGFSSRMRVETARDSGVTEFLLKPFSAQELTSRLTYIIEKPRQFVKTKHFFGPDRRRKQKPEFSSFKRGEDPEDMKEAPQSEIAAVLEKLRDDVKSD